RQRQREDERLPAHAAPTIPSCHRRAFLARVRLLSAETWQDARRLHGLHLQQHLAQRLRRGKIGLRLARLRQREAPRDADAQLASADPAEQITCAPTELFWRSDVVAKCWACEEERT